MQSRVVRGKQIFHLLSSSFSERLSAPKLEELLREEHGTREAIDPKNGTIKFDAHATILVTPSPVSSMSLALAMGDLGVGTSPHYQMVGHAIKEVRRIYKAYLIGEILSTCLESYQKEVSEVLDMFFNREGGQLASLIHVEKEIDNIENRKTHEKDAEYDINIINKTLRIAIERDIDKVCEILDIHNRIEYIMDYFEYTIKVYMALGVIPIWTEKAMQRNPNRGYKFDIHEKKYNIKDISDDDCDMFGDIRNVLSQCTKSRYNSCEHKKKRECVKKNIFHYINTTLSNIENYVKKNPILSITELETDFIMTKRADKENNYIKVSNLRSYKSKHGNEIRLLSLGPNNLLGKGILLDVVPWELEYARTYHLAGILLRKNMEMIRVLTTSKINEVTEKIITDFNKPVVEFSSVDSIHKRQKEEEKIAFDREIAITNGRESKNRRAAEELQNYARGLETIKKQTIAAIMRTNDIEEREREKIQRREELRTEKMKNQFHKIGTLPRSVNDDIAQHIHDTYEEEGNIEGLRGLIPGASEVTIDEEGDVSGLGVHLPEEDVMNYIQPIQSGVASSVLLQGDKIRNLRHKQKQSYDTSKITSLQARLLAEKEQKFELSRENYMLKENLEKQIKNYQKACYDLIYKDKELQHANDQIKDTEKEITRVNNINKVLTTKFDTLNNALSTYIEKNTHDTDLANEFRQQIRRLFQENIEKGTLNSIYEKLKELDIDKESRSNYEWGNYLGTFFGPDWCSALDKMDNQERLLFISDKISTLIRTVTNISGGCISDIDKKRKALLYAKKYSEEEYENVIYRHSVRTIPVQQMAATLTQIKENNKCVPFQGYHDEYINDAVFLHRERKETYHPSSADITAASTIKGTFGGLEVVDINPMDINNINRLKECVSTIGEITTTISGATPAIPNNINPVTQRYLGPAFQTSGNIDIIAEHPLKIKYDNIVRTRFFDRDRIAVTGQQVRGAVSNHVYKDIFKKFSIHALGITNISHKQEEFATKIGQNFNFTAFTCIDLRPGGDEDKTYERDMLMSSSPSEYVSARKYFSEYIINDLHEPKNMINKLQSIIQRDNLRLTYMEQRQNVDDKRQPKRSYNYDNSDDERYNRRKREGSMMLMSYTTTTTKRHQYQDRYHNRTKYSRGKRKYGRYRSRSPTYCY